MRAEAQVEAPTDSCTDQSALSVTRCCNNLSFTHRKPVAHRKRQNNANQGLLHVQSNPSPTRTNAAQ